jgi:hypothetical protein
MREQQDNDGALFKVEGPKEKDWHDDYKGSAMVGGKEYWVGLAKRTSKAGEPFLKLNFRPKNQPPAKETMAGDIDDEIPFR